jgi:hypothetical protein
MSPKLNSEIAVIRIDLGKNLSRRMIAHYRTGSRPIPRVVALACEALSTRWKKRAA